MKKIYFFLTAILLLFSAEIQAQLLPINQPEQDACNALQLCGNSFTSPYSYQGEGLINDLITTQCGNGEGNSMWLRLEVNTAGIIVFTISPLNLTDDYDFAVINITNSSCSTFTSNDVIRCNFNNNQPGSNVNGVVGLNTTSTQLFTMAGAFGGSFLQQINANAGDVYLIMINNFGDPFVGGPSSGFTIDFTGSTAIFNDNGRPHMLSAYQPCGLPNLVYIPISENILCSSIEPSGTDFAISGGGVVTAANGVQCSGMTGYTDTVILTLASPLPPGTYTVDIQNGTDGNTLIDLCNHADTIPDQVQFVVNSSALAYDAIIPPACYQFKIKTTGKANCSSIAPDGSDFSITGPQVISVAAAVGVNCDALNLSDTILITLSSPILSDGTYTITSKRGTDGNTITDNCGLAQAEGDFISFDINSFDGLVTAMPDTVVCDPGYLFLSATDNAPQPSTYRWSPGTFLADSTALQTLAYIAQSNQYTILAIDKDGCPHRAITNVTLSERSPVLFPLEATICRGDKIQLNASGGESYNWIAADMTTFSCIDCAAPIATPTETTIYSVSIADENNCADTLSAAITVNQLPLVIATPNDTTVKYGTDLQLTASGASYYTWFPASQVNYPNSPAPVATIKETVVLFVTGIDENGCRNIDSIKINVDYKDILTLPTAFSPNGDGKNDIFKLGSINFQKLQEFRVFNRWGQEIFSTTDPIKGWDGSYNGQPQDMGVYHFVIRLANPDGNMEVYKGDVTLVR